MKAKAKQRKNKGWENLKPCKPGERRNPSGRPKGSISIWARIRRELRAKVAEGPHEGKRFADLVAKAFVKETLKGKWPQMKELLDREEGKPPEQTNVDGKITVEVVYRPQPQLAGRVTAHADDTN